MIVYACRDLIFATKVRATAEALGLASRPARDAAALHQRLMCVDDGKGHAAVTGVLIDMDLGAEALALIRQAKTVLPAIPGRPAVPGVPGVVAFGSHVATELLDAARAAGADFVLPRSQFTANLPAILERLAGKS
jgi:hypothetical protein